MVHSSSRYYYDTLELETARDDEHRNDCNQIEWPLMDDHDFYKWSRQALVVITYIVLVIAAINIATIIGILIYILINPNNSTDTEFALYKNTRFKECAAMVPDASNCSAILSAWEKDDNYGNGPYYASLGHYYIMGTDVTAENKVSYDWCQTVSCFNDYKAIPSSANDSAMGPIALKSWWVVIINAWGAVWNLRKTSPWFRPNPGSAHCRGLRELGIVDWVLFIYSLAGPVIGWWVSFADSIINPVPWPTLNVIAWLTTWGYSSTLLYHPYSCILERVPRIARVLPWIFGIVAALQCAASLYIAETDEAMSGGTKKIYDSYTCLPAQVAAAPGTSTCSAEEICSKSWLFSAPYFIMPGDVGKGLPFGLCISALVMAIVVPVILALFKMFSRTEKSFKRYYKMWSPLIWLSFLAIVTAFLAGVVYPIELGRAWNQRKADALVAYDVECRVAHVALSP